MDRGLKTSMLGTRVNVEEPLRSGSYRSGEIVGAWHDGGVRVVVKLNDGQFITRSITEVTADPVPVQSGKLTT